MPLGTDCFASGDPVHWQPIYPLNGLSPHSHPGPLWATISYSLRTVSWTGEIALGMTMPLSLQEICRRLDQKAVKLPDIS